MKLDEFLTGIDPLLKKENLKFVIIRNYEKLPQINIGNDIDVIIPRDSTEKWILILKQFCKENKLRFTIENQLFYCTSTTIEGVDDKNGYLKLDLNNILNWRGVDFYDTDILVENSRLYKNPIYTAQYDYIDWYITFCHSFLYGGFIKPIYIKQFRAVAYDHPNEFNSILESVFTKKQANYIIKKIKSDNYFIPRYIANKIRISVLFRNFIKRPIYTIYYLFLSYYYDWK